MKELMLQLYNYIKQLEEENISLKHQLLAEMKETNKERLKNKYLTKQLDTVTSNDIVTFHLN